MMIEKSGSIRLKDIPIPSGATPEQRELAQGMVRVNHLYRSALKVAVTQMEILDEEFASLYDHSPIHHIEYRIKTLESISDKLRRRGYDVTIDNIYAYIQDVAGIRVICNYLDDIYYLRSLLTRSESFKVLREVDYIQQPKESGYRSLHLIIDVPIVISEGTLHLPVWSMSCGINPTAISPIPTPHGCGYAARPSARSTGRCRTSIRARNPAIMSKAKECCGCAALLCFGWFLRTDGMLFPIAFPFVPPAAHFSQQLEKWAKESFETDGFKTSFPLKSFVYYRS